MSPIAPDPLFVQIALAFVLCAVGGGLILAGRLHSVASQSWPTVKGMVVESAVVASRDGRQYYRPIVRYRYEVNGQRYEGSRIQRVAVMEQRKYTRARKILDLYRTGEPVAVHYDPTDPRTAVLQPDRSRALSTEVIAPIAGMYALFVIGTVFIGH
jgi:Protein of unknown function (DUF3592)